MTKFNGFVRVKKFADDTIVSDNASINFSQSTGALSVNVALNCGTKYYWEVGARIIDSNVENLPL